MIQIWTEATNLLGNIHDAVLLESRALALAVAELLPLAPRAHVAARAPPPGLSIRPELRTSTSFDPCMLLIIALLYRFTRTVFLVVWIRRMHLIRFPLSSVCAKPPQHAI